MRKESKAETVLIEGQSELVSRIAMYRPKFNASQKRIAEFLLSDEKTVLEMNIYEMAEKIGTSVATVTRFCQLIGYEGLADMKFHMQQQAVSLSRDIGITRRDSINVIKQKALQFSENSLHSCLMGLDNESLEQAVERVGRAERIMLCGNGSAGGVVQAAAGLLMSMGFAAFTVHDDLLQLRTAAILTEKDVMIAISYDGQAKSTGDAMMLAKKSGAAVILITSMKESLLSRYSDYVLYTLARTGGNAMNITATALCQLGVIQVLALGAVTKYYDRFAKRSRLQLAISDLDRYEEKQKEIRIGKIRQLADSQT
ncbi:MAG: MurR/RpiR family transcriptional regulator [Stomatobaculum sp.]